MTNTDNPLARIPLPLNALCNISAVKWPDELRPEHMPLLAAVEPVRDRNAPVNAPQIATRYTLVFPGSGFMRIAVKVEEPAPSVTQETLDKCGGVIRVNVDGFQSGVLETKDGGLRPYFKAARIVPIANK